MWQRATWHECAEELAQISSRFQRCHWGGRTNGVGWPRHPEDQREMEELSVEGVRLLRSLALAVRSEQDFGLIPQTSDVIGAIKNHGNWPDDVIALKRNGGFSGALQLGWRPFGLRQALNKIAHASPTRSDYHVGPMRGAHDLILSGEQNGSLWIAVLSILKLIDAIRLLPDANIAHE
jgi:hypothetical protein